MKYKKIIFLDKEVLNYNKISCNYSGCQVHGSKFKVSELVYRNNRMNFAFALELKPWQVMFICQARNLQSQLACRLPTKTETLNL